MMEKLNLSSSPHFNLKSSTQLIMLTVLVALLPECICAVVLFGLPALLKILISVMCAVGFETAFQYFTKQKIVIKNLSAAVTGVMLALVLPSSVPVWMLILGDLIAIVVAKGLFGGIGSNTFNPALTGRAFLFISFPAAIGASWPTPKNIDAISSATILSSIKSGSVTTENFDFLNYFLGNRAGCMGETSVLLILISFVFLLVLRIIDWRAPLAMVGTVCFGTFLDAIIGSHNFYNSILEVGMTLFTGGILFGATFMVTDYATSPITKTGRWIFGFGCGLITFLIRRFGGYPEGVMFSILIMNAIAPLLNNFTTRMYGYGKKGNKKPEQPKIIQEFDIKNAKEVTNE